MAKIHADIKKVYKPEKPFVILPLELMYSPAWKTQSINCRKLMDFLLIEHMRHGGFENGNLLATYDQLEEFGIGRQYIHRIITEAETRGLIIAERGGRKGYTNHLSRYTITFLPAIWRGQNGEKFYTCPTDDWKRFKDDAFLRVKKQKPTLQK